jgi:hypothetical protein
VNISASRSSPISSSACAREVGAVHRQHDPQLVRDLFLLALVGLRPPGEVDRPVLRRRHQPRPGVVGDAVARPALERDQQRVLRQVLGQPDVADQPRQAGDEAGGLDPPDRLDRRPGLGRCRLHQLPGWRPGS